jgi:hypothetical protein
MFISFGTQSGINWKTALWTWVVETCQLLTRTVVTAESSATSLPWAIGNVVEPSHGSSS